MNRVRRSDLAATVDAASLARLHGARAQLADVERTLRETDRGASASAFRLRLARAHVLALSDLLREAIELDQGA